VAVVERRRRGSTHSRRVAVVKGVLHPEQHRACLRQQRRPGRGRGTTG
jgi:hypothetical protein